jgi:hypothetical protein
VSKPQMIDIQNELSSVVDKGFFQNIEAEI